MSCFTDRGTGRTTRALQACPQGALYIVRMQQEIAHAKMICERLGRTDIKVVSQEYILREHHLGLRRPIVLDHWPAELESDMSLHIRTLVAAYNRP